MSGQLSPIMPGSVDDLSRRIKSEQGSPLFNVLNVVLRSQSLALLDGASLENAIWVLGRVLLVAESARLGQDNPLITNKVDVSSTLNEVQNALLVIAQMGYKVTDEATANEGELKRLKAQLGRIVYCISQLKFASEDASRAFGSLSDPSSLPDDVGVLRWLLVIYALTLFHAQLAANLSQLELEAELAEGRLVAEDAASLVAKLGEMRLCQSSANDGLGTQPSGVSEPSSTASGQSLDL